MRGTRYATRRYVNRRRREEARRAVVLAVALVALVGTCAAALPLLSPRDVTAGSSPAASTPRDEWREGTVPSLYQTDPEWAEAPYAGGTVAERGCGPTCLTMVYVALTGRADLSPADMCAFSEESGFAQDGMTAWALMTDGAALLGLASEELPASEGAVREALSAGRPIICSVRPGDFTTTGHFIVLERIDEDGRLVVHDPNSAERSSEAWDVGRVLGQCANLWAFSVA